MPVNSVSKRSSSVEQEDLKVRPPLTGSFASLAPPRGDESMLDVCADFIVDAAAGLNGIDPSDLRSACVMCDDHGRDMKNFQEKQPGAVPSSLSPALVAVLALYTAELAGVSPYGACNAALRSADRSKCKPFVPFIWFLMHALAKCDRYVGGNVYRGVKADLRVQYPKDREVTWFQFSSCTCDIEVEQSEQFLGKTGTRTLFSIELTTGRARVITKFSLIPSEAEVLLPPNSRFTVLGQLDAGNGLIIITLRELPSRDVIVDFDIPPAPAAASLVPAPALSPKPVTLSVGTMPAAAARPLMSPTQALADFKKGFPPESSAYVAYRHDVEYAAQLCCDFAAEEGKIYGVSKPLYEAAVSLKKVLACSFLANDWKAQISSALPEAAAATSSSFHNELDRVDKLQIRVVEEELQQVLQAGDIPQAEQLHHRMVQLQSAAAQRLKECDEAVSSLAKLTSQAGQLLARQPAWPRHKALLRFDLPLQRLTRFFILAKKWKQSCCVLRGRYLYCIPSLNSWCCSNRVSANPVPFPTNQDSLARMLNESSHLPDGHFCADLQGMRAAPSENDCVCNAVAQAAALHCAVRQWTGRRSPLRSSSSPFVAGPFRCSHGGFQHVRAHHTACCRLPTSCVSLLQTT